MQPGLPSRRNGHLLGAALLLLPFVVMIDRGIVSFVAIQLAVLALVGAFPGLATWLPKALFP